MEVKGPHNNDLLPLWETQAFSWTLLAVSSWQSNSVLSLGSDPHSMNLSTQAPLVVGNVNRFLAGKCFSLKISVMNSLCFPFLAPVAEFPSEFLQLPTPLPPSLTVK